MTSQLSTIALASLHAVTGGQGRPTQTPSQDDEVPPRTWGQVGREYGAACLTGAAQSAIYGGKPRNWKQAATNAAIGCGMGVGMKAVDDVGAMISGGR